MCSRGSIYLTQCANILSALTSLYVSMVEAGEVGGVLDEVMNRLAKLLEDVARLQNQIKSALTYPVAVGFIAVSYLLRNVYFLVADFRQYL